MSGPAVLVIDCDAGVAKELRSRLAGSGISVELSVECMDAMKRLRENDYAAIVLDPVIRECMNGFVVLSYIEMEQPALLNRLFLFTGMSVQTIQRTAPTLVSRLFHKPSGSEMLAKRIFAECAPRSSGHPSDASLLLVEDDPATAKATGLVAAERGYAVTYAVSGSEAIAALSRDDFDVIILDLILPGVDGFAVLEHLESQKPHLLDRVIVTSGIPEKYAHGLDLLDIRGVLRKPIELPELDRLLDAGTLEDVSVFEPGGETPLVG